MIILAQIGQIHSLIVAMFLLLALLFCAVAFMIGYLVKVKKGRTRLSAWKKEADQLIWSAIFFEEEGNIPIPAGMDLLLTRPAFRECLIDEIITAKKDLAGSAADNLVKLYDLLDLQHDSLKKMASLKWHIKARGIQELAAMNRKDKVSRIYRHTNHRNEFIRMEAQLAIVQLFGHEGLRFLDVVSQPITEWQQIKLLAHLPSGTDNDLAGMERWLAAANESVIAFALKLVGNHHRFDCHDQAAGCLHHPNPAIRVLAVKVLGLIHNETTAQKIIDQYTVNDKHYRSAALEVLASIAAPDHIAFLRSGLLDEDNSLKLAAARALSRLGEEGVSALDSFDQAAIYPWSEIIQQAKSEQRA